MDGNVRGFVYTVSEYPKEPEVMTLRDAVEWFKLVGTKVENANFAEQKYLNERWAYLCTAIAEREGTPPGYMSYMLNELALSEMRVAEQALVEAEAVVK